MSLTKKQLAKVHVAQQQLGLDESQYRELLAHLGVRSSAELDNQRFDILLGWFRELGFTDTTKRPAAFGQRAGMATDAQVLLIRSLWAEWADGMDERALDRWLSRFGVSTLRFVDAETAGKAITGLRAMVARKAKVQHAR